MHLSSPLDPWHEVSRRCSLFNNRPVCVIVTPVSFTAGTCPWQFLPSDNDYVTIRGVGKLLRPEIQPSAAGSFQHRSSWSSRSSVSTGTCIARSLVRLLSCYSASSRAVHLWLDLMTQLPRTFPGHFGLRGVVHRETNLNFRANLNVQAFHHLQ